MQVYAENEYGKLEYVLMAYPQNFDIKEIINKMQRKYVGQIDHELANQQYNDFVNTLIAEGVKVQFLNLIDSPEQVYTRDIGFTIHNILFISTMAKNIRKDEPTSLLNFITDLDTDVKYHDMINTAEGGDVFVHHDKVFIGKSRRTTEAGINEIKQVLHENKLDLEIIPVDFNVDQLHLDCVFNILDQDTCIITDQVYNPEVIEPHFKNIIRMSGRDVEYLATNFVHLGNGKLISTNQTMTDQLNKHGYNAIYLPYSEFIKSGGSVRCSTLPIVRKK
jgi:N-dimethylarginine dimethylaminohydrolase